MTCAMVLGSTQSKKILTGGSGHKRTSSTAELVSTVEWKTQGEHSIW